MAALVIIMMHHNLLILREATISLATLDSSLFLDTIGTF